jgi:putative MATE family efflux protein
MIGTGASSLIARSLGAGDTEKANHTVTVGFVLTVVNSAIVAAVGMALLTAIVKGLGAKDNTFGYTQDYVRVILLGSLFTMGNYTFGQLLRGEGSVRLSIVGMVVGTLTNIALDPLLIFGFGLRVQGAALATVGGNTLGMAASIAFYLRGRTLLRPRAQQARPRAATVREIFWVGVPATLETLLTSAAYVVNNNLAIGYGELTVAATGIAQKTLSLGSYIYQGFAAGTQPIMGYNYGAGNFRRMLAVLRAGVLVVSGTELCVMLIYGLFAPFWIGLFSQTPEVIATGAKVLRAVMWILPFVGAVSMSRMSFQAMGKPQYAFGITVMRQLVLYVPLLLVLSRAFGFAGMIWAQPVTELIMMTVSVSLLVRVIRREESSFFVEKTSF